MTNVSFRCIAERAYAQAKEESLSDQFAQAVVLPTVAGASHMFMHGMNITEVCISGLPS